MAREFTSEELNSGQYRIPVSEGQSVTSFAGTATLPVLNETVGGGGVSAFCYYIVGEIGNFSATEIFDEIGLDISMTVSTRVDVVSPPNTLLVISAIPRIGAGYFPVLDGVPSKNEVRIKCNNSSGVTVNAEFYIWGFVKDE